MGYQSLGVTKIENWLTNHAIPFEKQKRFKDCRWKFPLPFDFYIPEINCLIEFDGEQHFSPVGFSKKISKDVMESKFKLTQLKDQIKTNYAKDKGFKFLRIPFFANISEELSKVCHNMLTPETN